MRIQLPKRAILLAGLICLSARVFGAQQPVAQNPTGARELFNQLNALSIDPGKVYALRGARLTRDRVKIYFNRGYIGFFQKAAGEITGAVFIGDGEVLMIPPNSIEKGSLARFTHSAVLEENFDFAYLRFTDQTAAELLAVVRPIDPDDPERPIGLADRWDPAVHRLNPAYSIRILEDLLGSRERPYFAAQVHGRTLGPFGVSIDERTPEAVDVGAPGLSHGIRYLDTWCSFPSLASKERHDSAGLNPVHVDAFDIDTRIEADNSLEGHAALHLISGSSADRIVPFLLSGSLQVSEVRDEQNRKLEVFRAQRPDESGATIDADWIAVALPSPVPAGSKFLLSFDYQGKVISDVGNGVLFVAAHADWYPNCGTENRARYDLTFRYPERLTLVATGAPVETDLSPGWRRSRWRSDIPLPVAGFNLGPYDSRHRNAGESTIEVYATPEAEASLERRHAQAQVEVHRQVLPTGEVLVEKIPKAAAPLDPAALLDDVAEAAVRTIQYYETLFGKFPYPRLAIAQIPGDFGQGWPELVYLPTLAFISQPERAEVGAAAKAQSLAGRVIVEHEIAHQWWGNEVGWKTPHDQWLSEGFATYAALLYLSREKGGQRLATETLRGYKHDLLSKTAEGETVESGGPIWLGQRLSNSLDPDGYDDIVYKKACWVLHMLRILMTDPATGSDEQFFRMLRDFVSAYSGSNPSTEDLIRHVAKYTPPALDLEHNHRLDWYFDDWVYGIGIPTYKLKASTRKLAADQYLTQGTIGQSGVPADFQMLVPVIATYEREKKVTLGLVAVSQAGGHFRFRTSSRPSHVALDEDNLLAVTK